MQTGIFAKTFAGTGAEFVLAAARRAGYETVQFNMTCLGLAAMPDEISDVAARSVMQASQRTGVGIAAVSATYNMIHPDQQLRDAGLRRLNVILSAAKAMGTNLVTLCTGTRDAKDQWRHHPGNDLPDAWKDLTTEMAKALKLAERHDVNLGVEPELANVVNSAMRAKRLIADMQSQKTAHYS